MKKIAFNQHKNVIAEKLKQYRVENKLTQGELAAKMQTYGVNLDQQMISRIESNARIVTDYELAFFCMALGVSIEDMLGSFYRNHTQ